jgi:hypothetical protein
MIFLGFGHDSSQGLNFWETYLDFPTDPRGRIITFVASLRQVLGAGSVLSVQWLIAQGVDELPDFVPLAIRPLGRFL